MHWRPTIGRKRHWRTSAAPLLARPSRLLWQVRSSTLGYGNWAMIEIDLRRLTANLSYLRS